MALIVTLCFSAALGCATNKKVASIANGDTPALVISMKKTSCYGTCPVYELSVFSDHTAVLEGERHLDFIGKFKAKVPDALYRELVDTFENSSFFDFDNEYTAAYSDLPTTYLFYSNLRRSKKIRDYYGSPEALKQLESRVAELIEELDWEEISE